MIPYNSTGFKLPHSVVCVCVSVCLRACVYMCDQDRAGSLSVDGRVLGELEACIHADGIAQLVAQDALLAVVGQLEQVEAGGGGGQPAARLLLADGEEAPQHAAQSVPRVLERKHTHTHTHTQKYKYRQAHRQINS